MKQVVAAFAAAVVWNTAASDCIATAHRAGEPIPSYLVLATRGLAAEWEKFEKEHGTAARLPDVDPNIVEYQPLNRQCLVDVAIVDARGQSDPQTRESVIVQKPCDEITVGRTVRLTMYRYCIDVLGGPPNFYATFPYRHAHVTERKRFGR
jgi:hypothetical protein